MVLLPCALRCRTESRLSPSKPSATTAKRDVKSLLRLRDRRTDMEQGYLALVLHAHLPFVRHPEYEEFLEEDWFYEAITETYIPLLRVFEGLVNDGVDFRITMSITPTLASMFTDPLLQERYLQHLDKLIELTYKELERTRWQPEFNELAKMYNNLFIETRALFVGKYNKNLVGAFKKFQDMGKLE